MYRYKSIPVQIQFSTFWGPNEHMHLLFSLQLHLRAQHLRLDGMEMHCLFYAELHGVAARLRPPWGGSPTRRPSSPARRGPRRGRPSTACPAAASTAPTPTAAALVAAMPLPLPSPSAALPSPSPSPCPCPCPCPRGGWWRFRFELLHNSTHILNLCHAHPGYAQLEIK